MKLLLPFVLSFLITAGCAGTHGEVRTPPAAERTRAFSEHGLRQGEPLGIAEGQIGVVHLETQVGDLPSHPGTDTGTRGSDVVEYRVSKEEERTFCFIDDDGESHRLTVSSPAGGRVAEINAGACSTLFLGPGIYTLLIASGGVPDDRAPDTVFVYRAAVNSPAAAAVREKATVPASGDITVLASNSCPSCDLRDINLRGAHLSGANLRKAILAGADLRGADLNGAHLEEADLSGADLSGATMIKTNLRYADLTGAGMSGVNARQAIMARAKMKGAGLTSAVLIKAYLTSSDLSGADLSGADLTNIDARYADFSDACLKDTNISTGYLYNANLTGADLRNADLSNADLTGVIVDRAILDGANPGDAAIFKPAKSR